MSDKPEWYLDVYSHRALGGKDFPVNSFGPDTMPNLAKFLDRLYANSSGLDRFEITKETNGQCPVPIP